MHTDTLFRKIEELYPTYLGVWEQLCKIESPTEYKEGVDKAAAYLIGIALQRGWKIEQTDCAPAGDAVCITMNPESTAAPVCLSGHLDTVHALGAFGETVVERDGEKIYGPGVTDCKGGIVAGMLAMDALQAVGFTGRPVRLLLQTDEEVSSRLSARKTINYIIDQSKDAVAFLNLEGGSFGQACLIRKGIASYTFSVAGVAAHSSKCATSGANAIADAAHKIIELEKFKDESGLTCNCAIISGGKVLNTVPDCCEFSVNVRFATAEQYEYIDAFIHTLAATEHIPGCRCTVSQIGKRVAMPLTEKNTDLLSKLNGIWQNAGLTPFAVAGRPGGSDAADVTMAGIPCIDSLGVVGGKIHSREEYAYLDSLRESAKRLAAAICYL